jgi:POT family proton-dependent oligopeptide transporter
VLIGLGAVASAAALVFAGSQQPVWVLIPNVFVAVSVIVAMVLALWALANGALPKEAGAPKTWNRYSMKLVAVLGAVCLVVPSFAWLCAHRQIAGYVLYVVGAIALGYVFFEAFRVTKVERERLFVILIMCVFSMLFWAFFEQAGSSINNFTDRNVDRVAETRRVTEADVGTTLDIAVNQEQLGYPLGGDPYTLDELSTAREEAHAHDRTEVRMEWPITRDHVGMGLEGDEVPASVFQATNPIFILIFGLVFTALWGFLAKRKMEPSTPVKFVFGLLQLGAGFGVLWLGAAQADGRGMVGMSWLVFAYLLHTTGELCLSPVGLSMVSRMAPARMVATMMGAWYLATAFSQYLAGLIAMLTGVHEEGGGEGPQVIPPPIDTLGVYADVFGKIALASFVAAAILLALTPLVKKWMHSEAAPNA